MNNAQQDPVVVEILSDLHNQPTNSMLNLLCRLNGKVSVTGAAELASNLPTQVTIMMIADSCFESGGLEVFLEAIVQHKQLQTFDITFDETISERALHALAYLLEEHPTLASFTWRKKEGQEFDDVRVLDSLSTAIQRRQGILVSLTLEGFNTILPRHLHIFSRRKDLSASDLDTALSEDCVSTLCNWIGLSVALESLSLYVDTRTLERISQAIGTSRSMRFLGLNVGNNVDLSSLVALTNLRVLAVGFRGTNVSHDPIDGIVDLLKVPNNLRDLALFGCENATETASNVASTLRAGNCTLKASVIADKDTTFSRGGVIDHELSYYCRLNACGREEVRQHDATLEELVGLLANVPNKAMEQPAVDETALAYGLLREAPHLLKQAIPSNEYTLEDSSSATTVATNGMPDRPKKRLLCKAFHWLKQAIIGNEYNPSSSGATEGTSGRVGRPTKRLRQE